MRVLVVALHFPYPTRSGAKMRVYQLLRQISSRHDVTLLSYARPDQAGAVAELRREFPVHVVERPKPAAVAKRAAQLCAVASSQPFSARETYSQQMEEAIVDLCARESFDVVQLERALLYALPLPPAVKVILDEHNVEYEVFQRMSESERTALRRAFHRLEARRFRRLEELAWRGADGCAVTSDREEPVVRAAAPDTPVAVVPNGVDLDYFAPAQSPVRPCTVVFNGTLEYRPNVDAAHHLVDEVWPLVRARCPQAQLTIVRRTPGTERHSLTRPGVTVTGEVADIRPHMHDAAVVAVPVRMGGGTRLKVVEGLAMGKAMVSTTLGCEGVAVRDGEHLLIGDDPQAFADQILRVFTEQDLAPRLGAAGRALTESDYSWALAGERLEVLYQRVAGSIPETTIDPPTRLAATAAAAVGGPSLARGRNLLAAGRSRDVK